MLLLTLSILIIPAAAWALPGLWRTCPELANAVGFAAGFVAVTGIMAALA